MALGKQRVRQMDMLVTWAELPRSPGHAFYDKLQSVLSACDFDGFVERQCAPLYAPRRGRRSLPPGRYFRMLLVGYFEGIDSERGLEWRCADSLSLREFLRLGERERVPDHSWLSRTRGRLPLEVHDAVFTWVLQRLAAHNLIKGERIGVDASTMEANAALRTIVRRDSGEGYREMLTRMARESGIETPTAEDLIRLDRNRKGKKLSNADWESPTDPDARIAKLKDGRTHLAYKPEHAMDLDTGAVVAAELHPADQGDTTTLPGTLAEAQIDLDPDRLVFVDESWASTNMARRYGRCPRGERLRMSVPHGHWKTTTVIAGLRNSAIVAPFVIDCAVDRDVFETWVEHVLVPELRVGDVVVMDNLSSHKGPRVQALIQTAGAELRYLPPYSPDFNPIENAFAKLKTLLRKEAARTVDTLWSAIGRLVDLITPAECVNMFAAAGYDPD